MPTSRGITVSLQSQYDALTIPEQILAPSIALPLNASISSLDLDLSSEQQCHSSAPASPRSPVVHVKIPTFPCSQFWISYACVPPQGYRADADVQFYYFKLVAGGRCILSWGVGEQDDWSGKTMYALFNAGTDFVGKKVVEKRGLFFPKRSKRGAVNGFEVRVFRAKARRREVLQYETVKTAGVELAGLDLTNIGRLKKGERQRMYTYALIDPKDEPYVTFRYTIDSDCESTQTSSHQLPEYPPRQHVAHSTLSKQQELTLMSLGRRLSVPPRRKLIPSSTRSEPTSPVKKVASSSEDSLTSSSTDLSASKRRDWVLRTPSPMVSQLFDSPATPLSGRRKMSSGGTLKSVVTNAWKRREEKDGSS